MYETIPLNELREKLLKKYRMPEIGKKLGIGQRQAVRLLNGHAKMLLWRYEILIKELQE
jgi:hypothetical protein